MLRRVEEIFLLLLDEKGGSFPVPEWRLSCTLAGAVLMDLAQEGRIDTDVERLTLLDSSPLDDDLLDPVLADIAQNGETHSTGFWVKHIAGRGDEIREKALARLAAHGILDVEEGGFFSFVSGVSHTRRYPLSDQTMQEDVRLRVMRVLFNNDIPDPYDVEIICLADACGLFEHLLSPAEFEEIRQRLAVITRMDLIGRTIAEAIAQSESPAGPPPAGEIPIAPPPPIRSTLRGLYREYMLQKYAELGPIFQIRQNRLIGLADAFDPPAQRSHSHGTTIMMGPEANQFFSKHDKTHFRSFEFWTPFAEHFGAMRFTLSMVSEDHFRMRRVKRPGYACAVGENLISNIVDVVRSEIASWPVDEPIVAVTMGKRLIYNLSARIMIGMSVAEYFDDLSTLLNPVLKYVLGVYPRRWLYRPRLQRARRRMDELTDKILAAHDPEKRGDRPPDIIDDLIALHRTDPQFLPEMDLKLAALEPLWIPMDTTGHATSFYLYAFLKYPELLQRGKAEADALFAQGTPTPQAIHQLDVIHRVLLETLRLHAPLTATRRTVSNSFEFAGCQVPAGLSVVVAFAASHRMSKYFPDPERFDIDWFLPPRDEHKQSWAYMPYGLGTHRCLGGYLAEFLMKAVMATILHDTEIVLDPPGYTLNDRNVHFLPTRHPKKSFRFRLVRRR